MPSTIHRATRQVADDGGWASLLLTVELDCEINSGLGKWGCRSGWDSPAEGAFCEGLRVVDVTDAQLQLLDGTRVPIPLVGVFAASLRAHAQRIVEGCEEQLHAGIVAEWRD